MDTASHHRKIELQSPEDFAYLVNNVRRAATASVAAAFPPVDGDDGDEHDDDDLHARVESLVEEYIRRTFFLAAPNLTINGLDVDPSPFFDGGDAAARRGPDAAAAAAAAEPDVEPFDTRRRQRVEDLAREEEDLLRVLARLKRQLPGKAVAARAAAVSGALAADEGAAAAAAEAVAAAAAAAAGGEGAALPGLADTAASYRTAVDELVRLKQEMPATVARMERAREAGAYARAEG